MDLSIIIISWNTRELLGRCLASVEDELRAQPTLSAEIWVVDNGSRDDSVALVRRRFPAVRLVANQHNAGFAAANNQALRRSRGRTLLLLNPDTELEPGALAALLAYMAAHPEAGAAGPYTRNPDGSLQISCYPAPTLARELWRLLHLDALWPYAVYRMDRWDPARPRRVDGLQGACLLLRREALEQVGLLDERYFIYSEEVDLCYRLQRAGWQLAWVPRARIVHYGGQSTQQAAADMFLQLYRGKLLFFRKHYGPGRGRLYKLVLLLAALVRLLLSPLAWLEGAAPRQQHQTLVRNYRRLVKALPGM